MELTITVGSRTTLRLPIKEALAWMAQALTDRGLDVEAACGDLHAALDAYQRSAR